MQLRIKDGEKILTITKPERKRLIDAIDVLDALQHCGQDGAAEAKDAIHDLLRQINGAVDD